MHVKAPLRGVLSIAVECERDLNFDVIDSPTALIDRDENVSLGR